MKWDDAATGLAVEYTDLIAVGAAPGGGRVSPTPFEGPQFAVTARGFIQGYARTDAELAALGVSGECIAQITRVARRR